MVVGRKSETSEKENSREETIKIWQQLAAGDTFLVAISRKVGNSDVVLMGSSTYNESKVCERGRGFDIA